MRSKRIVPVALAAIVVLALGVASFALAEVAPEFRAEKSPSTLDVFSATGLHEQYIRLTNEKGENIDVKCSTRSASVLNPTAFPTATIQSSVAFAGCKLDGAAASVGVNECEYKFNLVAGSSPPTATMDIVCPFGKEIEFQGIGCKVTIPSQTGLKHVIYSNNETAVPPDAVETFSITGLKYSITAGCRGQTKGETKTNGIYTDGLTMQATNAGKFVKFSVE